MKLIVRALLLLVLIFGVSISLASSDKKRTCEDLVPASTENLIAYLSSLIDAHVIDTPELEKMRIALDKNQLINPISEVQALINPVLQIHRKAIEDLLELPGYNRTAIKAWLTKALFEEKTTDKKQEVVKVETKDPFRKMKFHLIKAGKFMFGEEGKQKVLRELTHDFEMMDAPVTQYQWTQVMKQNPSHFAGGQDSIIIKLNGEAIEMHPDHPVEDISWWSAIAFANELSKLHGLKPTYILPEDATGDPATGHMRSESRSVKINAPGGNIYLAEGYRLPTETEQEFVLRNRGRANDEYVFGSDLKKLKDYAWFNANADQITHRVGEKLGFIIDGNIFFDLHGNVGEWGNDWFVARAEPGENPQGPFTGNEKVIRGGNWVFDARSLQSGSRWHIEPNRSFSHTGLRLVRTIK